MTNHPNRAQPSRTIHYWMLAEGAYGAGAKYAGTDRKSARKAAEEFSDAHQINVELHEGDEREFDQYGASWHLMTYVRHLSKWIVKTAKLKR
jgi:hypothetical protein